MSSKPAKTDSGRPISGRHCVFLLLLSVFAVQSYYVYTDGTAMAGLPPASKSAIRGQQIFRDKNCTACHQFYGLGGYMGPDLTNIISNEDKGEDYARFFIEEGSIKMPNFNLNEPQVNDLIEFLKYVDAAGQYNPAEGTITWFGTVKYNRGKSDE